MRPRVLLINANKVRTPYPVPPLGTALIYRSIEKRYQPILFDGFSGTSDGLIKHIEKTKPAYIGISIRNIDDMVKAEGRSYLPDLKKHFFKPIRDAFLGPIILGGAGFSIFPRELLELAEADYGIIGEAEKIFPMLLDCLEQESDPSSLPGVIATQSHLCPSPYLPALDINTLPHADLDLILDYAPYLNRGAYPIQTKRGCAHRCIYCSYPYLEGKKYRRRDPVDVVDEIENTSRRFQGNGITFEFVDSTFNDPKGNGEAICMEIVRRGLQLKLRTMGINPANVTGELLELMKEAGFSQIDSTPDSASPTMLRNLKKNFSLSQLQKSATLISKHAIPCMWFFLLGGPGETEQTISETVNFIEDYINPEDLVHLTEGLRIYPHTELYQQAVSDRLIDPDESLLSPRYFISPLLGEQKLEELTRTISQDHLNCIRATESTPRPELMAAAIKRRKEEGLDEPLFRTLLRIECELQKR